MTRPAADDRDDDRDEGQDDDRDEGRSRHDRRTRIGVSAW
jgi:hypothetical protein